MAGTIERTLALKIIGDISGLKKTQKGLGSFTRGLTSWGKALAGGVVIGGVERLVGSLGDAWKGYRSGEKAAAQLRKTWKNLGMEGRRYQGVLDKVTASTLRLGTSDDEAVEAFSRSLARTRDYQQSLRELSIAQDLVASGAAGNLESAFRLIQQAGKGSARVVDRFGLTAKTSAGRIRELGDQVKGTAKAKAKLDPLGVLFNRMAEDAESIVGAFAKGDFKGVVKGLQGLGETVADALFGGKGKDNIRNSKKAGLVNQFGKWGGELAKSIQTEFGKVDWGKTLQDTLNSALGALRTAVDNGTLANLVTVGAALAGAVFGIDLFITAASAMFRSPRWILGAGAKTAGAVLGFAFRGAMFVVSRFVDAAALTMGTLARDKRVGGSAKGLGASVGGSVIAGVVAGLTGAVAIGAVADALTRLFTSAEADWTQRGPRPLPDSPFKWPWQQGGFFFPDNNATGTAGFPGGWSWVGERGPELMKLPAGTQVMSNRASVAAAGSTVHLTVHVNAPVAADGARVGQQLMGYIDQALGRGHRFRYRPVGGLT